MKLFDRVLVTIEEEFVAIACVIFCDIVNVNCDILFLLLCFDFDIVIGVM